MNLRSNTLFGFLFLCISTAMTACNGISSVTEPNLKALGMPRSAGVTWDSRPIQPWGAVESLQWSKDSKSILVGSATATIVWDVETGVSQKRFNRTILEAFYDYWNPDNTKIVSSGLAFASVNDLSTGLITRFHSSDLSVYPHLEVSQWNSDGQKLFGYEVGNNGRYYPAIWDANNNYTISVILKNSQRKPKWSSNGLKIALESSSIDSISGFDIIDSRTSSVIKTINNQTASSSSLLEFSPDSNKIASDLGSNLGNTDAIKIFDIGVGSPDNITQPTTIISKSIRSVALSWSPDNTRLASADADHKVTVWDAVTGLSILTLQNPNVDTTQAYASSQIAWSPDGTKIVSSDSDTIQIWNAFTGELLRVIKYIDSTPHASNAYGLALSPSGNYVASASRDQNVIILNSSTGSAVDHFLAHNDSVYSITWKPDNTQFATASKDGTIKIWTAKTASEPAKLERVLTGHTYTVRSLAWNPNGSSLASASWDGTVKLWNPETGLEIATLTDHTDFVNAVTWNADGSKLASASSDKTIKLWNSDGTPITTLSGHTDSVLAVVWSPDGTKIASGGTDKTVRIWDSSTGALLKTIEGSLGAVRAVVWTQDGTGVISGGTDQKVRGWIIATGEEKFKFNPDFNTVFSLALNKDGQSIIVGSASGNVSSWKLGY